MHVADDADEAFEARRRTYWDLHDFSVGRGLEIGPLHRALVPRDRADVRYVDVMDRDRLVEQYSDEFHGVPVDQIPPIDFWLIQDDGRTLSLAEATKAGAPFDWVVASHVVEHVPDVIGWLDDIAEIVTDDGVLVLAVPDKRYTFDVHRPLTSVGQMIDAHLNGDQRPSARAVYDHFAQVVTFNHTELWRGHTSKYDARIHGPEAARQQVELARSGEYVDCHVWLFTPDTFLHQMRELRQGGFSRWYVEDIVPTPQDDIEFRVRLRRVPRHVDPTREQDDEVVPATEEPEWLVDQAGSQAAQHAAGRIAVLEDFLLMAESSAATRQRQLDNRRRRVQRLEQALDRNRNRNTELTRELARARREVQRLRKRARKQAERIQAQEQELSALRSTPWARLSRRIRALRARD